MTKEGRSELLLVRKRWTRHETRHMCFHLPANCQLAHWLRIICMINICNTRQRASTSMYSLTFCIRIMSPECHHWKPAVQAAAVMLRMPPIDGQSLASQPRALAIYGAQF